MPDLSSLGTIVLGGGGLVTGVLALFSAKSNRSKTQSETKINNVSVEQAEENLFQSKQRFWREEVEQEVDELRNEVAWLRILIENHVPWDWEVVRLLKLAGINTPLPPSLNYLRDKKEEK